MALPAAAGSAFGLCGDRSIDSIEQHPDGILTGFRLVRTDIFPAVQRCFPSEKALTKAFSLGILSTPCNTRQSKLA
jgi:hypothetical protein